MDRVKRREARTEVTQVTDAGLAKVHKPTSGLRPSGHQEQLEQRKNLQAVVHGRQWQVLCVVVTHLLKMAAVLAGRMSVMLTQLFLTKTSFVDLHVKFK